MNTDKPKIQLRGGFSDRNGIDQINQTIQITTFDDRTRASIMNWFWIAYKHKFSASNDYRSREYAKNLFWTQIAREMYSVVVQDEQNIDVREISAWVKYDIMKGSYDEVLTALEFLAELLASSNKTLIYESINYILKYEYVGYRFINGLITPITDPVEMETVENVFQGTFEQAQDHMQNALRYISDRDEPDYKNSIKESLTALESACCEIAGEKGTLKDALNLFETQNIYVHPALRQAILKIYGFASDAKGIRHSGDPAQPDVDFKEAKLILVMVSAIINYLKEQYSEISTK